MAERDLLRMHVVQQHARACVSKKWRRASDDLCLIPVVDTTESSPTVHFILA